jgi:hypothetical protein
LHVRIATSGALEEASRQQSDRHCPANEHRRAASSKPLDIVDELVHLVLLQIRGEMLDLLSSLVGVLSKLGLIVTAKLVAGLANRFGHAF